ncbi:MAG: DUF1292 domain-containing protein [Firmicutes bacterium]|nr:DUF1292 domain-containing protein [Bacillota bacterium]
MSKDVSLLKQLLDEKNDDNIFLFDEAGESVELEQIAIIPHNDELFALLRPLDADEDAAAVFRIITDDEESIESVEDEDLAMQILKMYNEQIEEN